MSGYLVWQRLPEAVRRGKNYTKLEIDLVNPNRLIRYAVAGDFIDIDYVATTANLQNVEISLNGADFVSLDYAPFQSPFAYFFIRWKPSEDGKKIVLIIGRELFRTVRTKSDVRIVADLAGLAKDSTLKSILAQLDVALSTRASEATVSSIESRLAPVLLAEQDVSLDNSAGGSQAEMAFFATPVSVPDAGDMAIQLYLDTGTTVKLEITRNGTARKALVNSGQALAANAWHEFTISVLSGDTVQLYADVPANTTITGYVALILRKR